MSPNKNKELTLKRVLDFPTGRALLHDPVLNQGTAFMPEERELLGLRGLLPTRVLTQEQQAARAMLNFARKPNDLEKYIFMLSLEDRNENLFYRVVLDHLEEMMPIIYTPTVGQACQEYGNIFRRPRGLFISADDRGQIAHLLANWPSDDVEVIVVTDGERILGLGDLGANGMGIPVGKIALYTACGGLHPARTLPVILDVGTENEALLADPLYLGLARRRLRGPAYDALVAEFLEAVNDRFPHALVQFEDFGTDNAFRLLHTYRDRYCVFNDDIQGTAGVTLAGLLSAMRITGGDFTEQRILFLGAGEAGVGIADLIVSELVQRDVPVRHARHNCWLVDSRGLVTADRTDLAAHKQSYAHESPPAHDLLTAIRQIEPHAIVGVSGQPRMFTQEVVQAMAEMHERPIIFALSNPTSKSECTAEQAYAWSGGRAVFASGSPFDPVDYNGRTYVPGQGNNAYVFPGIGLGVVAARASRVVDEMFLAAANRLAELVDESDLAQGRIYPPLSAIRRISLEIAVDVAEVAFARDLARIERPADLHSYIAERMYQPEYPIYR